MKRTKTKCVSIRSDVLERFYRVAPATSLSKLLTVLLERWVEQKERR